jgi:hypothetical protein
MAAVSSVKRTAFEIILLLAITFSPMVQGLLGSGAPQNNNSCAKRQQLMLKNNTARFSAVTTAAGARPACPPADLSH